MDIHTKTTYCTNKSVLKEVYLSEITENVNKI